MQTSENKLYASFHLKFILNFENVPSTNLTLNSEYMYKNQFSLSL